MPINYNDRRDHPYYSYHSRRYSPPPRRRRWLLPLLLVLIGLLLFIFYRYQRPIESIVPRLQSTSQTSTKVNITWSTTSQAAIGSTDQGVLAVKPNQTPRPIASTAKLITALTILKKKPLKPGELGPTITLGQKDVDIYNQYFTKDGSVAKVAIGQQLSEYQILQGILLPSANNYADSLAIWAFGSLEQYQLAAQKLVVELGMKNTTIGSDASGFSPTTTSTAEDLTKLAVATMKNPTIVEIAKQEQVSLPLVGIKQSTNWLLGADGIVGLKTGNTADAGGVYVFASKHSIDKIHAVVIVGAVQGEPNILVAMHKTRELLNQVRPQFKVITPIKKGQMIASYNTAWGQKVKAVASQDIKIVQWQGRAIKPNISLRNINAPLAKGDRVGSISFGDKTAKVILKDPLYSPNWQWRVLR